MKKTCFFDVPVFGGQHAASREADCAGAHLSVMLNFVISPQSAPPSLSQAVLGGGKLQFQVVGNNRQSYRIDATTDLLRWAPAYTNFGSFPYTFNDVSKYPWVFFRAVTVP